MRDYIKLCRYQINDAPTCRSRIFFKESMRATMNAPGLKGVNLYSYQYLYRPICPRIRVWSLHDSKFQCACIWTNPCITTCRFFGVQNSSSRQCIEISLDRSVFASTISLMLAASYKDTNASMYRGRHASTYSASRCESVNESKYRGINGYLNEGIVVSRHPGLRVSRHEGAQACRTRMSADIG